MKPILWTKINDNYKLQERKRKLSRMFSENKKNNIFCCTLWGGGDGGQAKRTLCTLVKMLIIMNSPLHNHRKKLY